MDVKISAEFLKILYNPEARKHLFAFISSHRETAIIEVNGEKFKILRGLGAILNESKNR